MNYLSSHACSLVAGLVATASIGLDTSAAIDFKFDFSTSVLELAPGATGDVHVFLIETLTDGDTSRLVDEVGLSSAQVTITQTAPLPADPATIFDAIANEIDFNDSFGPTIDVTDTQASILEYVDIFASSGFTGTDLGEGVRSVFLGTMTIQAGLTPGQTTIFTASDDPDSDDTILWTSFDAIDALIAPGTFTVVTIPEPGSLALLGLGSLLIARRRRA